MKQKPPNEKEKKRSLTTWHYANIGHFAKETVAKQLLKVSTVFRTQGTKQKQTSRQNNELHMKANT